MCDLINQRLIFNIMHLRMQVLCTQEGLYNTLKLLYVKRFELIYILMIQVHFSGTFLYH